MRTSTSKPLKVVKKAAKLLLLAVAYMIAIIPLSALTGMVICEQIHHGLQPNGCQYFMHCLGLGYCPVFIVGLVSISLMFKYDR